MERGGNLEVRASVPSEGKLTSHLVLASSPTRYVYSGEPARQSWTASIGETSPRRGQGEGEKDEEEERQINSGAFSFKNFLNK